jgi:hypothetical protein
MRGVVWGVALALVLLTACAPATPVADTTPVVQAKLLATVYLSPTPDAAARQATRLALSPTPRGPTATPPPSPTVYIGVFLEPAPDDEGPLISLNPGDPAEAPPSPIPANCPITIGEMFIQTWSDDATIRRELGCPIENLISFTGAVQIFERGAMYFEPNGFIWAIAPNFAGTEPGRYWVLDTIPEVTDAEPIEAPPGFQVPQFGFGAVWRSVDGVREALGFARTEEQSITANYQRFTGGTMLADMSAGQIYALTADNAVYGPF